MSTPGEIQRALSMPRNAVSPLLATLLPTAVLLIPMMLLFKSGRRSGGPLGFALAALITTSTLLVSFTVYGSPSAHVARGGVIQELSATTSPVPVDEVEQMVESSVESSGDPGWTIDELDVDIQQAGDTVRIGCINVESSRWFLRDSSSSCRYTIVRWIPGETFPQIER